MKQRLAAAMALVVVTAAASPASALTRCDMTFSLDGWSVFYKEATGSGVVRCDNGQQARVDLESRGGGITFGRSKIVGGKGDFSPIADIDEIFGNYATAEAHAGMGVSSAAQVVTKGPVSLGLHGTGNGVDLGFAFGRFTISPAQRSARHAATPPDRDDAAEPELRSEADSGAPSDDRPIQDEELPASGPAPESGY